jgi:hypothetical protein
LVAEAATGEGEPAAHRAQVDDLAPPLGAHAGEHELAHPDQPEHIRVELAADLIHRHRLDRAILAVAGVVDENADRALLLRDGLYSLSHRPLVGDVEREQLGALGFEHRHRIRVARGCIDIPAAVGEELRRGVADARRAAGDEHGLGSHSL